MADASEQVRSLREAIILRARELADEHVNQGELERSRIIHEMRDKVQLMEKKELLAAKENADREYHRMVQASELRMQAELDRNRWGLVQSVMYRVARGIESIATDADSYETILMRLLEKGVEEIAQTRVVAELNFRDRTKYAGQWQEFVQGIDAEVVLSEAECDCSGGVRIYSEDREMMVDNTFEGIMRRNEEALMRLVFERLFSEVRGRGVPGHG